MVQIEHNAESVKTMSEIVDLRESYKNNVILGYINVNSIRNKLGNLNAVVGNNIDVLCIAETKLDKSFPVLQFLLAGFKTPYRLDVSDSSGGLLIYVNKQLPSRRLHRCPIAADIQVVMVELNLRKHKWLLLTIYRPPSQTAKYFLDNLSMIIDFYSTIYENVVILGDFNSTPDSPEISTFMSDYSLHSLINSPTCFKSVDGRCIDLILTNKKHSFQKSQTFETGVSDHHHLIYTMMKQTFVPLPPKTIVYRSYKNFSQDAFKTELQYNLGNNTHPGSFTSVNSALEVSLDKFAPYKKRVIRGNNKPHVSKKLRKAIMKRSRLKNIYNRTRCESDFRLYKKQRNFVNNLNRQEKRQFFKKIECSADSSKQFWKAVNPFFSNKSAANETVSLLEGKELIQDDDKVANVFIEYFNHITDNLGIVQWKPHITCKSVFDIVDKYSDHPSIIKIKQSVQRNSTFSFSHIHPWDTYQVIMGLNPSKSTSGSIPTKILQQVAKECSVPLTDCLNNCINDHIFPSELKLADVIPIFKKGDETDKENYRPISILPSLSKVFEKLLFNQINKFFEDKFNRLLCGFRAKYSTQYALLNLLHKWQACRDKSGKIGTILMDLSKAFDCLPHELLLAKMAAYGLEPASLELLHNYLRGRMQRVRLGSTTSKWLEVLLGVPQGSILGPLLFNIFINDFFMFLTETEVCNFADDNTLYSCAPSIDAVINDLEIDLQNALLWFGSNQLVANPAKFQLMFLGYDNPELKLRIGNNVISPKNAVELLGLTIDKGLSFDSHIKNICKSANFKVRSLYRIRPFITQARAKQLSNAFILSNFNYCPLLWMFCKKSSNDMLNTVHKRALRAVTGDYAASFDELISNTSDKSIHQRSIIVLLTEIYKCQSDDHPDIVRSLFVQKIPIHFLRNSILLKHPQTKTVRYGVNSVFFRGVQLWNSVPDSIKLCTNSVSFKEEVATWAGLECPCKLCN